jgi:hypothetical protein
MNDYHVESGLPPTIPPPEWIHNVTCYSPLLLEDQLALQNAPITFATFLRTLLIVTATVAIVVSNALFIIVINRASASSYIKLQPRIILTGLALNDLANGLLVMGLGLFPAIFECWPFGELACQLQVSRPYQKK